MMRLAIAEAKKGAMAGEIPVGAILAHDGQVIGKGFNQPVCYPRYKKPFRVLSHIFNALEIHLEHHGKNHQPY